MVTDGVLMVFPFCHGAARLPSLLLSINIADRHTSKQVNRTLHISCIYKQRKRAPSRMPRAAAVSILHVINQVFHAINSSGVFQCAHRIIVTVVIGNI